MSEARVKAKRRVLGEGGKADESLKAQRERRPKPCGARRSRHRLFLFGYCAAARIIVRNEPSIMRRRARASLAEHVRSLCGRFATLKRRRLAFHGASIKNCRTLNESRQPLDESKRK